jgi:outer membrane protein
MSRRGPAKRPGRDENRKFSLQGGPVEMRKIFFVLVGLTVLWIGAQPAYSAEELKIAFLDTQKVLDKTKAGQKSKAAWEEYRNSRKKVLELDEKELKKLEADLKKQQSVLSAEARREKESSLQKKVAEFEKKMNEINKELSGKQMELIQEFNKGLLSASQKVAEKNGYSFVFDRNPESNMILYAKEAFDITDEVIKEYDKASP